MITVFTKQIEKLAPEEAENIIGSLSTQAHTRLNKKRNKDLHLASLCALSLLNDEQRKDLDYTNDGAPFFKKLNRCISISHGNMYVAVAITSSIDEPVGVDIEENSSRSPSVRFLTENEQAALKIGTPYIEIWTKKEALFKFLKNDSTPFINLDSTAPEKYGAKLMTVPLNNSTLTVCAPLNATIIFE